MMTSIVAVQQVKKVYGKVHEEKTVALKNVNFQVETGEFIGIMGASGSGKSTLLNILSTIDRPTSGQVLINGYDITKLRGNKLSDFRAHQIGFIFQDFNLLEDLTVEENIALPLSLQEMNPKRIKALVILITKKLSISSILKKYPAEISGGQKQRAAAARALITKPAILLGDEPTGSLDSSSARELLNTMTNLNQKDKISILLVTHDPVSASFCQRILFIKDGVIGKELRRNNLDRISFYHQILNEVESFES